MRYVIYGRSLHCTVLQGVVKTKILKPGFLASAGALGLKLTQFNPKNPFSDFFVNIYQSSFKVIFPTSARKVPNSVIEQHLKHPLFQLNMVKHAVVNAYVAP